MHNPSRDIYRFPLSVSKGYILSSHVPLRDISLVPCACKGSYIYISCGDDVVGLSVGCRTKTSCDLFDSLPFAF